MNLTVKKLVVKYNDMTVGFLEELTNGSIAFQYDENWVRNGFSISPFSLPLTDEVFISKSDYFNGLFGVFYDSLPDGWGELLMRRMLAKNGINYDKVKALTKLSLISDIGLGALTYEPTQADKYKNLKPDLDKLAEEAKTIFDNDLDNYDLDEIFKLGGASGGSRPKAHVRIDGEDWIIKFPSSFDPVDIGILEYKANKLALEAKIKVNEFKLFPSKDYSGFFGAKRFDRVDNKGIHVVSLSSLLETTFRIPNLDYAHLFQVIKKICVDQEDLYEAYRRMCFNVLYHNRDDHGKNFAFIYDENIKGYTLSPFYDITKTDDKPEHEMTVLGNEKPKEKDLINIAKEFNMSLKKCKTIISEIKNIVN